MKSETNYIPPFEKGRTGGIYNPPKSPFRKGGLLEGDKQKIANNIKNGMLKEKYENIFPVWFI